MNILLVILATLLFTLTIFTAILLIFLIKKWKKNNNYQLINNWKNDSFFYEYLNLNSQFKKIEYLKKDNPNKVHFIELFEKTQDLKKEYEKNIVHIENFKSNIFKNKKYSKAEIKELKFLFSKIKEKHFWIDEEISLLFSKFLKYKEIWIQTNNNLIQNFPIVKNEFEKNNKYYQLDNERLHFLLNEINIGMKNFRNNIIKEKEEKNINSWFLNNKNNILQFIKIINISKEVNTEIFFSIPQKINELLDLCKNNKNNIHKNLQEIITNFISTIENKWRNLILLYKKEINIEKINFSIKEIYMEIFIMNTEIQKEINSSLFLNYKKSKILDLYNLTLQEIKKIKTELEIEKNKILFNEIKIIAKNISLEEITNQNATFTNQVLNWKNFLYQIIKIATIKDKIKNNWKKHLHIQEIQKQQFFQIKNILENITLEMKEKTLLLEHNEEQVLKKINLLMMKINNHIVFNTFKDDINNLIVVFVQEGRKIFQKYILKKYLLQLLLYLSPERVKNSKINATIRISEKLCVEGKYLESLNNIVNFLDK